MDKWSKTRKFEFLTEVRRLTFRIVMYIFLSSESEAVLEALEREYTALNYGVRAMAINVPGFAYHSALKVCSFCLWYFLISSLRFMVASMSFKEDVVNFRHERNL